MTPGLEAAAARYTLVDRAGDAPDRTRVTFSPEHGPSLVVAYDLGARRAVLEAQDGRALHLTFPDDLTRALDPTAWRCTCPAAPLGACLHAALAARGLGETTGDDAPLDLGADIPDARYALDLEAPPGLTAAAAAADASVERADGGLRITVNARAPGPSEPADSGERVPENARTSGALVTLADGALRCDCPMGAAPACLHRLIAAAWARRDRPTPPLSLSLSRVAPPEGRVGGAAPFTAPAVPVPGEDLARFGAVLERVDTLVAELISFGLQRATAATLERIDALALAARALGVRDGAPRQAGLGRIARTLDRLRQVMDELRQRLVTTTEYDVLRELSVLRNLARAIRANTGALPLADIAGATQQEYIDAGVVDAQGLGLEAWTTPAGYAGVTAFVADLRTGRVLTRTATLPAEIAEGFADRSWGSATWADQLVAQPAFAGATVTYLELARGRYLLTGAMIAPDTGRLSGSGKTQLARRPPVSLTDPRLRPHALQGAADAVRLAARLAFDPLGRPPTSPPVGLVPVRAVSPAHFDRLTQRLTLTIETAAGARAPCALTYRDERALWIDNLERLGRITPPPRALFCRLRLGGEGEDRAAGALILEPLTAHFEKGGPRHLTYRPVEGAA